MVRISGRGLELPANAGFDGRCFSALNDRETDESGGRYFGQDENALFRLIVPVERDEHLDVEQNC
jgi:hypothetical protein